MTSKIAILVDSGCDLPQAYLDLPYMYVMPLHIIKDGVVFTDKVDITSEEVHDQLPFHDFKTSLPSGQDLVEVMDKIVADGFSNLLVVTISSNLSGTHNMIKLICEDYPQLNIELVDTLNVAMGAGLSAIHATEMIDQDKSLEEIAQVLRANRFEKKVFFCIKTLEYLKKGGRIGKVTALIGGLMDLKPIITCNQEGIYTTIAKVRSRKQSLMKLMDLAIEEAKKYVNVEIAIAFSRRDEEVEQFKEVLASKITNCKNYLEGQIGPAMIVHAGPGLIGVCVRPILKNNE